MKSNSCRQFIYGGYRQALWVFAVLLSLGIVSYVGMAMHLANELFGRTFVWIGGFISGPVLPILTRFDISNARLQTLCFALVLPYWASMGTCVGFILWKVGTSDSDREQFEADILTRHIRQFRISIATVALVAGGFSLPFWPSFVSSGSSVGNAVINNLRQLDGAMGQLAYEKKLPADYIPTRAELDPYLNHFRPIGPERYVLNSIGEAPYALLDSDWRVRRRGWSEGYTIPKGTEYRLPMSH
jgi:hypothetical protein